MVCPLGCWPSIIGRRIATDIARLELLIVQTEHHDNTGTPMKNSESTKRTRKDIAELVDKACEKEFSKVLSGLESHFMEWRAGRISCFRLNELIHEYHDGVARDLWAKYRHRPSSLLPVLVADGVVPETEVPSDVLAEIRESVDAFKGL
jgi:hypothetical protein